jgi:tetratricopeptide (TPR) repeat protein
MNRMLTTISGSTLVAVMLLATSLAGCKTDNISRPSRVDDGGQLTSIENPAGINVPPIHVADRSELDLVEEMILHRTMYARLLRALAVYYSEHGYENKANWARNELNDLRRVKPYRYITDAEVPVATLRPQDSIAEADRLFEEGMALMKRGGHGVLGLYHQGTMKEALAKFKELIDRHPTSDKIDDAAFYIAEIHKEYMEEKDNTIALQWYKRAIEWNPNLPYKARFQMAVVYDHRLHEREEALYWYQQVLEKESHISRSNTMYANNRIRELTTELTRHSPAEPVDIIRPAPVGSAHPVETGIEASPPPVNAP